MKSARVLFALLVALFLAAPSCAAEPAKVEVLFMNHGPLRPTIQNMQSVFAEFEGRITVEWHDFESEDGQNFMRAKGLNEHIPLMIWINGKVTHTLEGKAVAFRGFPSGTGPAFFQGKWNMELLAKTLDQASR